MQQQVGGCCREAGCDLDAGQLVHLVAAWAFANSSRVGWVGQPFNPFALRRTHSKACLRTARCSVSAALQQMKLGSFIFFDLQPWGSASPLRTRSGWSSF